MKPYRKRAKAGWNCGKRGKENSDREERQYAKVEIRQFLNEMDEDYRLLYKKSKRKRNEKARLLHRIEWCQKVVAEDERRRKERPDWGVGYFSDYCRTELRKSLAEFKLRFGDEVSSEESAK